MKDLLILLIALQIISCSPSNREIEKKWLCENKMWLLKTAFQVDTVLIDLSKSTGDQLNYVRNQLTWNSCNQTNILNGKITLSDSTTFHIAYRARPYCENDTNMRSPSCFPDPSIDIYFISDTLISVENKIIKLNHLSKDEKYFSLEDWKMFKNKIFRFHSTNLINAKVKEKILQVLINRHFEILDSISLNRNNENICELDSMKLDSLKKSFPVYFAQTELPPFPDSINVDLEEEEIEQELIPNK